MAACSFNVPPPHDIKSGEKSAVQKYVQYPNLGKNGVNLPSPWKNIQIPEQFTKLGRKVPKIVLD